MSDPQKITRRTFLAAAGAVAGGAALADPVTALASPRITRFVERPSSTASQTLVYAAEGTPESFDLEQQDDDLTEQVGSACYGGDIVRFNVVPNPGYGVNVANVRAPGNSGISSGLAEAYEVSSDARTYTFHLRTNAKSCFGNPLTADDILYSFQRQLALNSNGAFFDGVMGVTPQSIHKLDQHTVRFSLAKPSPLFLRIDAMKYFGGVFDSVAAKAHATKADPWSKAWLGANTAGFDAYYAKKHYSRPAVGARCQSRMVQRDARVPKRRMERDTRRRDPVGTPSKRGNQLGLEAHPSADQELAKDAGRQGLALRRKRAQRHNPKRQMGSAARQPSPPSARVRDPLLGYLIKCMARHSRAIADADPSGVPWLHRPVLALRCQWER